MKKLLLLLLTQGILFVFLFISTEIRAQDSLKFPTPAGNPYQLFFLQRSQNTNTESTPTRRFFQSHEN